MTDTHPLRRLYDAVEREVAPRLESVVQSGELTTTRSLVAKSRQRVGREIASMGARVWHSVNLPAGTDVKRLRRQLGSLDREVRQLGLQIERMQHAQSEGRNNHATTAESKRSARPGATGDRP